MPDGLNGVAAPTASRPGRSARGAGGRGREHPRHGGRCSGARGSRFPVQLAPWLPESGQATQRLCQLLDQHRVARPRMIDNWCRAHGPNRRALDNVHTHSRLVRGHRHG
jgi:hypothetical protein